MFLFARSRRMHSGRVPAAMEWVVRATEQARQITGQRIDAWTAVMSPEVGTVTWTLFAEHLADIETAGDKLAVDPAFLRSVEESESLFDGPISDGLATIVHATPDLEQPGGYVAVVTATAANGRLTDAMALGIEVADAATRVGGQPTVFAIANTGGYGNVMWFTASPDIQTLEASEAAVNADADFLALVDRLGSAFAPGAMQSIYRRIL